MSMIENELNYYNVKSQENKSETLGKETFVKLIQDNKVSLYRLAMSIVKNEHEVEDAISETILKAFQNFNKLKSISSFKSWIMKILVNECYSTLKKKKRIDLQENMEAFNLTYEDNHQNELIYAINKLDKDFRTILTLFYYEDMSIKDISDVLSISQGTVKSRLSRAKAKLKIVLESDNKEE